MQLLEGKLVSEYLLHDIKNQLNTFEPVCKRQRYRYHPIDSVLKSSFELNSSRRIRRARHTRRAQLKSSSIKRTELQTKSLNIDSSAPINI